MLYFSKNKNKNKDWLVWLCWKKNAVNTWQSDEWEAFSRYYLLEKAAINKQETSAGTNDRRDQATERWWTWETETVQDLKMKQKH